MTTITKAIEDTRWEIESVRLLAADLPDGLTKQFIRERCVKARSTPPKKPMTEDELLNVVYASWKGKNMAGTDIVRETIRALRDANVLYVAAQDEGEK